MSVTSTIDLEQLQHELQSARGAFDKWALNTVSAADQLRDTHTKKVSELRGDIESLKQRQQELSIQAENLRQCLSVEHSQEEALQAELSLVQAEEAALPLKISKLQEALRLESIELQRRESAIAHEETTKQKTMSLLRKNLDTFRTRLGLSFRGVPGEELSFVFTSIDPKDHARQFAFGIKVQEGQTYTVTTCEPPINAVDDLLQSLNKGTIQFSAFVQKMRRQFQHLC
ncbi:hypothetical protein WJX79_000804 [Trebouxia sp. C0005]